MLKNKKIWALVLVVCLLFIPCVASAEESSFVTYTDGNSYEGLPPFPTVYEDVTYWNNGSKEVNYWKLDKYILYYREDELKYYLVCPVTSGSVYLQDGKADNDYYKGLRLKGSGNRVHYEDEACTVVKDDAYAETFQIYTCGVGGSVWTCYIDSRNYVEIDDGELVQSSCNIYEDDTLTSVFIQPAVEVSLCKNLSAQKIVELTTQTMVGLVPSVIGLLILVTGFWMAYRLLAKALRTA